MTNAFSRKQMGLAASCALALCFAAGAARAETDPAHTGYLVDSNGTPVTNNYGECWHTSTGPPPTTPNKCDPAPAPAAKVAEPAPEPVARFVEPPQPPVVPVVVAAAAPATVTERVSLDADALFDFDKAVLRPEGRDALDEFVARIGDIINPEKIMAVGHTDRIGSQRYNQRLSEQRAEAVTAYLASKGIEPSRMQSEGRGEMQPVTKTGECNGAKVLACLQPDRRVEVDVTGSRIVR